MSIFTKLDYVKFGKTNRILISVKSSLRYIMPMYAQIYNMASASALSTFSIPYWPNVYTPDFRYVHYAYYKSVHKSPVLIKYIL